jgi:hypothetical protein
MRLQAGSGYCLNMHFLFTRFLQKRIFEQPENSQLLNHHFPSVYTYGMEHW